MNLGHVFEQGNAVLIAVFLLLMGMSITSWYIIFWKSWNIRKEKALLEKFKQKYVTTPDWPIYENTDFVSGNASLLLNEAHKIKASAKTNNEQVQKDILTMYLCQKLDNIRIKSDNGLTLLASIGSASPALMLLQAQWVKPWLQRQLVYLPQYQPCLHITGLYAQTGFIYRI